MAASEPEHDALLDFPRARQHRRRIRTRTSSWRRSRLPPRSTSTTLSTMISTRRSRAPFRNTPSDAVDDRARLVEACGHGQRGEGADLSERRDRSGHSAGVLSVSAHVPRPVRIEDVYRCVDLQPGSYGGDERALVQASQSERRPVPGRRLHHWARFSQSPGHSASSTVAWCGLRPTRRYGHGAGIDGDDPVPASASIHASSEDQLTMGDIESTLIGTVPDGVVLERHVRLRDPARLVQVQRERREGLGADVGLESHRRRQDHPGAVAAACSDGLLPCPTSSPASAWLARTACRTSTSAAQRTATSSAGRTATPSTMTRSRPCSGLPGSGSARPKCKALLGEAADQHAQRER
jgi:hypothetical protein